MIDLKLVVLIRYIVHNPSINGATRVAIRTRLNTIASNVFNLAVLIVGTVWSLIKFTFTMFQSFVIGIWLMQLIYQLLYSCLNSIELLLIALGRRFSPVDLKTQLVKPSYSIFNSIGLIGLSVLNQTLDVFQWVSRYAMQ